MPEFSTRRIAWADTFDRDYDDALLVLDEIGNRIVASIANEIETIEPAARVHLLRCRRRRARPACSVGPIPAVRKALKRAGHKFTDVERIEINEAFAAALLNAARPRRPVGIALLRIQIRRPFGTNRGPEQHRP